MGIKCLSLWAQTDEKDKHEGEPNGAFMLSGSLSFDILADVTLKAGVVYGVAIRRNKFKTDTKQPDYYGELYEKKERS